MVIVATSIDGGGGGLVNVAVIIGAILTTLLLILIIITVMVVVCRRRKIRACSTHGRAIPQLPTHNSSVQSQHDRTNRDMSSQLRGQINPTSRIEAVNALYILTTVKSLGSILQQHHVASRIDHVMNGCDVIITPNPSYAINPNSLQTGRKAKCQYDYVQADDGSAQPVSSDGEYDDVIAANVSIVPNPSYTGLPQDGQNVKLEDNPSFNKV